MFIILKTYYFQLLLLVYKCDLGILQKLTSLNQEKGQYLPHYWCVGTKPPIAKRPMFDLKF